MAGLAVTIGLLAWALHGVDAAALLGYVRRADPWLVAATIGLATLTFPLRTVRWRLILRDADGRPLPFGPLWHATAIGFMANNLLPVRAGEFARAYAARQALPVRFTTALASVGVERVLDGLVLVGLLTLTLAAPSFPRHAVIGGTSLSGLAAAAAAVFVGLLLIALLVVHRPAFWLHLLGRVARAALPTRLADRVAHAAAGLVAGLDVLRSPVRFLGVLLWSLVLWLVNAGSFAVCFRAFGLSVPPEGALLLQGIIGFGVALPASPGYVGVFEAATRATLAIYGVDATRAVGYALAYHVGTFFPITLLGLLSLSRMRLHLRELRAAADATD
ncbi:MAG TPA: lysylphosphatidylglycerol synthase transmembrane domain-containing protein [Gemmatimonadales bacterium]|nr:lysylphosphatidylglycerol synthase transmembrane domain-containing protein [Gemmatimonadales bacterium]